MLGAISSGQRWRAFADVVALALGINVWISLILLPGVFVGAWHSVFALSLAVLPLLVLGAGVWKRSELLLLLGFPCALTLPAAYSPELFTVHVYGIVHFSVVAVGVVAFLLGASVLTSFHDLRPPLSSRRLSSSRVPMAARWRRRTRIYRYLTVLSLIFPVVFFYSINFDPAVRAFVQEKYSGRVASQTTMLNLAALGAWIALYSYAFLGVLKKHRTGDRELVRVLSTLRAGLRKTRPNTSFYVAVTAALALMAALLWLRH